MPGSPEQLAPIDRQALLGSLPPEWPHDPILNIRIALELSGLVFGVLDDDPTGTQTVHDALVSTGWSEAELAEALALDPPFLYILTNTRALPASEAAARAAEAARNLARAARQQGKRVVLGIRGDSTLRGHHPSETWAVRDALEAELGERFDGEIIVPFFPEGGRITVGDVHYVLEGDQYVPAGQTEFARDAAFGYTSSRLDQWVEEKTGGRIAASTVRSVSIEDLRLGGPTRVASLLGAISGGGTVIVNAVTYRDLEVFVLGLLQAETAGKRFLYRTAAGFVRVRVGQAGRPLLTREELYAQAAPSGAGGLIVVGSHVRRTSEQLAAARAAFPGLVGIELSVRGVIDDVSRGHTIAETVSAIENALRSGQDAVLFTSREVVTGATVEESLRISQRVSTALVEVVRSLGVSPRFMIAKGGITSSDLATDALEVRRAVVPGQVAPGVPCWILGPGSRFPGIPYVIFPGNVGTADSLAEVIRLLTA